MEHTDPDYVYNSDLFEYDICEELLEKNLSHLNKRTVLTTQKLSAEFCAKYMFCIDDIHEGSEDSYLYGFNDILHYQPHLDKTKFASLLVGKY
jgi:hypothetical protein